MSKRPTVSARNHSNTTRWAAVAAVGFVAVAAVAAIALSRNDRSGAGADTTVDSGSTSASGRATREVGAVAVTGAALAKLQGGTDAAIGTVAPTLSGANFAGEPITTAPSTGRRRLVVFLAHWCPHCRREVPRLVKLAATGRIPDDLDVTAVATATASDRPNYPPSKWLAREKLPFPVLVDDADSTAANAYGLSGYPFLVLLDADGKVVARASGEKELSELEAFVQAG